MADSTKPPGSSTPSPRRGGWQLPDLSQDPQAPPPPQDQRRCDPHRPAPPVPGPGRPGGVPPGGGYGPPVLAGGVAGEVRNISQGTIQVNNVSVTVVTFRLEQHDPSGGRASVVTVRLRGSQAIGFAAEGDWVEAQGKSSQGFVNVYRAVNRTSGAEYQRKRHRGRKIGLAIGYIIVIGFILTIALTIVASVLGG